GAPEIWHRNEPKCTRWRGRWHIGWHWDLTRACLRRRVHRSGSLRKSREPGLHDAAGSASKPDGYLLGSYRIATAPEPNSSRLTSFKSTCFDSPANNVGPWPASLGCTT